MFPKNWNEERIMEEVAFAFKEKKFVSKVTRDNGVVVETYSGKTTAGFEVEFIYNDGVLKSKPPKVNIKY